MTNSKDEQTREAHRISHEADRPDLAGDPLEGQVPALAATVLQRATGDRVC